MNPMVKSLLEMDGSVSYETVLRWWGSHELSTEGYYDALLENFTILFACNSANLENINITYHETKELFDNGKCINFTGDISHVLEVANQKRTYHIILKNLVSNTPISIGLIKEIHESLLAGCYDEKRWMNGERPGSFKIGDYGVGMLEVGTEPDSVVNDLNELIDSLNSTQVDVLSKAALFHLLFENIHPFADGNGRVGRVLLNYYLLSNGHPPVVIFNEDKETYWMALEVFDRAGKYDGFVKFLKECTVKTWQTKVSKRM